MDTQSFYVTDQVPGGVVFQMGHGPATPTATLIKHDDTVRLRVEESPRLGTGSSAWAAMHE
jgi:hypothetical protein